MCTRYLIASLLILVILLVGASSPVSGSVLQGRPVPQFDPIQVATDTVEPQVWLPEIQKNWPVLVRAGIWRSRPRRDGRIDVEFRVTADRQLCNFWHNIYACDMYGFNLDGCTAIAADGGVAFGAEGMVHIGRFVSPTEIEGKWSFVTPRCYNEGSWRASLVEE